MKVIKFLVFEKGKSVYIFNFNPTQSFVDYRIGVELPGTYKLVLILIQKI